MKILDYTFSPATQLLPYADNEIEKKTDAKVSSHRIEIKKPQSSDLLYTSADLGACC